jgi:acetoacetate decarboxylase
MPLFGGGIATQSLRARVRQVSRRPPAQCSRMQAPAVVEAHHFTADLTLPYGRVLYDYLDPPPA